MVAKCYRSIVHKRLVEDKGNCFIHTNQEDKKRCSQDFYTCDDFAKHVKYGNNVWLIWQKIFSKFAAPVSQMWVKNLVLKKSDILSGDCAGCPPNQYIQDAVRCVCEPGQNCNIFRQVVSQEIASYTRWMVLSNSFCFWDLILQQA
jgi:hypothetical protein